jgi:hypothetical protein
MRRVKRGAAGAAAGAAAAPEGPRDAVVRLVSSTAARPAQAAPPPAPGLVAVRLAGFDEERGELHLDLGGEAIAAALDPTVDPVVIRTAVARGERVIAQHEAAGWVVLGTLRTTATPGVDEGDQFVIKARRIALAAAHEVSVVSGAASFVMRAQGQVETFAENITARASSLHKIIGRMIRLN